jgi:hypothetical protein
MVKGPVSTEVTISIAPNFEIVAVISTRSAEGLGIAIGKRARPYQGEQRPRRGRLIGSARPRQREGRSRPRSSRVTAAST